MATSGPRKAIVGRESLPPLIKFKEEEYGYLTRYRIISEDRNRFSAWSPIFAVSAFDINNKPLQVDGTISVVGNAINIIWDDVVDRPRYDIFVKFDDGEYFYHGTSPIHSYSIINNVGAINIFAIVQIESINKEISEVLTICEVSTIQDES
jgi:hypothetical protein